MQSSLYVALSAQQNLQRRLDSIANNVANSSTVGFRAEDVKFDSIISKNTPEPVAFAGGGETHISTQVGGLSKTGNPLDLAIQGKGWFGVSTPSGTVYTRDGRFQIALTGELQTVNGYNVLDASGAPIQLTPNAGNPAIGGDGVITQAGRRVGALGLFQIDDNAKLKRFDNSGVIPDTDVTPVVDFSRNGVVQGFVEQSNVNPVSELSRLIYVQRAFDAVTGLLSSTESSLQDAIRTLGSTTG